MTWWLNERGHTVNHKRVARLMGLMGLQGVMPGPHTSKPRPEHKKYPYLLREMQLCAPREVWCADITYIPMQGGIMYLVAVMDWFSRYVVAWDVSSSMESAFCVTALKCMLHSARPGIFNTDQGSQLTSAEFTGTLSKAGVRISMDGCGRALDNVFIERLWRRVKYEDVYLRDYVDRLELHAGLAWYFRFYNHERPYSGIQNRTPAYCHTEN